MIFGFIFCLVVLMLLVAIAIQDNIISELKEEIENKEKQIRDQKEIMEWFGNLIEGR